MTENNQYDDENQTYDSQVAEHAVEMSNDDETFDIIQEIEQNEGYQSICRE